MASNPYLVIDLMTFSFDDGTYSHAYLIPFIMIYLVYESIQKGYLIVQFSRRYLLLSLLSLFVLLLLGVSQSTYLIRLLLPLTYIFLLLSVIKPNRDIIIAGSLFWFVTPIWGVLNGTLQTISTIATERIMKLTGIPVYVEENFVQIPAGVFEIAGGCSGLRYMITALALSLIYCHINLSKTRNIVLIFALAVLGSMITNWIRIVVIIFVGHYSDMQSPLVEDHNSIGWFVFVPFVALLFYVGSKLEASTPLPQKAEARGQVSVQHLVMVALTVTVISMSSFNLLNNGMLDTDYRPIPLEQSYQSSQLSGVSPKVFTYESVEKSADIENTSYLFTFSGRNDADKVDFYKNELVPDNWSRLSSTLEAEGGKIFVQSNAGQKGRIDYQLISGDRATGSYSTHRIHRLINALSMNNESQLYWKFVKCASICTGE
jgi:exosortase